MTRVVVDVEKHEVCNNCHRTIGYNLKDTFTAYSRDWQDNLVMKQCIHCPACGKNIAVCY
jgi:hypothetical protein